MTLDDDAAAVWAELTEALPWPLHVLGVQAGRDLSLAGGPVGPVLAVVRDLVARTETGSVRLRMYRPVDDVELPAVVYFHGGGWSIGSLDGTDSVCRTLAERAGCVVFAVDYRQAPEHPFPAAHDDAFAAFSWLVEHAADIGVDPRRVAVGGDSAGGNLAASVALRCRDDDAPRPCFQLLVYPAVECEWEHASRSEHAHAPILTSADVDWFWSLYLTERRYREVPYAVPARAASLGNLPPTAVLVADVDPLRDEGLAYARRLAHDGVKVETVKYDGVFHGFFTMVGTLAKADAAVAYAAAALRDAFARDELGAAVRP